MTTIIYRYRMVLLIPKNSITLRPLVYSTVLKQTITGRRFLNKDCSPVSSLMLNATPNCLHRHHLELVRKADEIMYPILYYRHIL